MKKVISVFLVCCLLAVMTMSAAAAPAPKPSIEDILNDYHAKASAAQSAGETRAAATYSRRGGGKIKTLEQETVDTLNEAGYEAYNVTGDNYDTLEASLKTDFSAMGLDPDGSYIVVVSGEEGSRTSGVSTYGRLPEQTIIDDGGSSFLYIYNGHHYTMRYMTVVACNSSNEKEINLAAHYVPDFSAEELFSSMLSLVSAAVTAVAGFVNKDIGSIASLLDIDLDHTYVVRNNALILRASASWTHKYVQILNDESGYWDLAGRAEYAVVSETLAGTIYDSYTGEETVYNKSKEYTIYSRYYNDLSYLKEHSAACYYSGSSYLNRTGNIDIFLTEPDGTSVCVMTVYEGL